MDELTELVVGAGMDTFILGSNEPSVIATFARDVVPAVRLAVAQARAVPRAAAVGAPADALRPAQVTTSGSRAERVEEQQGASRPAQGTATQGNANFTVVPTPDDGTRLTAHGLWDESSRPQAPAPDPTRTYTAHELATGQHLIDVHDHLRGELTQIRDLVGQVAVGAADPAMVRNRISEMTIRQNNWTVGAYCAPYCRLVTTHHTIEDQSMFPALRSGDPRLGPVVDRLAEEHRIIHEHAGADGPGAGRVRRGAGGRGPELIEAVDVLTDTLLSHLSYEERELVEPHRPARARLTPARVGQARGCGRVR